MKENKIEKLILDLSNRWECTPQEAVDRLNSMNESEINKLINSMTKKFKKGGLIDCLREGRKLSECKKCAPAEAVSVFGIPSLKYEEVPQNIPVQMNGLQSNLEIGKVRTDNNGAAIFESNFRGVPNQIVSAPTNLRIDESVLDRVNRSRDFHNRMQAERHLVASEPGLASYGNGGSVEKCKCGCDKITKAEDGNALYPYHKGKFVQSVDSNPLYPAGDGEGQISGEIRPFGDTVIVYRTPSHIYTQTRTTDGKVFIDHSAPHGSRRYYSPESKSRGFMRNVAPSWMVDLMNGVKEKFSTDVQTKKCGGSLPKKKKNYLKKK